ncbi:hypothetical protein M0802_015133 [Mischocyttarus mexicanus]|nr:hypothetical protein M0802_015133 [Mischocyttarus mexicanus]
MIVANEIYEELSQIYRSSDPEDFPVTYQNTKDKKFLKKYWKDRLKFNPDRFLPDSYNAKCYLPFGFRKRNCIGQKYAMIKMKGVIATILRKFIVKLDSPVKVDDVDLIFNISLKPAKPVLLRFNKR